MDIQDGISQRNRSHYLMDDSYFHVDEMSFHDLLCYIKDYAKKIRYYNIKNQPEGYWDELLFSDEIIVISEILILDVKPLEERFINNYNNDFETPDKYLTQQIDIVLELADHINSWYNQLFSLDAYNSDGFVNEVDFLIRNKLSPGFQFCIEILNKVNTLKQNGSQLYDIEKYNKIWWVDKNGISMEQNINRNLKRVYYNFNNAVYYLKRNAQKYFDASLKNQQHSPYISLLITFLKLYLRSREKMNAFTTKHQQFYYNDILKIAPRSFKPDSSYLLLGLKDGVDEFFIKKGTRLVGGKDENNKKLIYTADKDIVINKAKIAKLRTLYLEKNELIWPKCDCTNILKDEIPVESVENYDPLSTQKWPLFGGKDSQTDSFASLGFAISDKNLLLNEGNREVRIDFQFTGKSFKFFNDQLNSVKEDYLVNEVFIKLFSNIFDIQLTTEDGWYKVDSYFINCSIIDAALPPDTIRIQFKLSHNDEAITPCIHEIHGEEFKEGTPVAKFLINNESYLFPYSLFNELELNKITIAANVKEVKNIYVVNEFGRVDVSQPFYPFGSIPRVNSYFIFGNHEMAHKNITNLELFIKWNNLPRGAGGLTEYFSEYDEGISKYDYKCNFTFLNNRNWLPKEEKREEKLLFANKKEEKSHSEKINTLSSFKDIETSSFQPDSRKMNAAEFNYNNYAVGGFVKVTLTNPPFQFGHNDFPVKLAQISMLNAKKKKQRPLPNPPFAPMAEYITMGYSSESTINFSLRQSNRADTSNDFYHLHPWGHEDMMGATQTKSSKLLPEYKDQGNLFIGLENTKPDMTVSLFFNLLDDSVPEAEQNPPEITWQYLSSNEWKTLPTKNLISDSTRQFLRTGIILLRMPADINTENTVMDHACHWLKVSANKRLEFVCSVVSVSTQALRVTWKNEDNTLTHLEDSLPALTIAKPETLLSGIKTIVQATNSFDGKPEENIQKTKIRVSERLNHKNRAITPWDYELLILENFPDIYKVKCLPNMSSKKMVHPGNVLITVISKIDANNLRVDFEPMVNNSMLLKIKDFIRSKASGFANIEVRNPVYERIQVRCSVKIKAGLDAGYFINELNNELIQYLTPWQSEENNEPGFGKVVKCTDVLSFIQSLDYIEFATDFSMLQITHDKKVKYSLFDTAVRTFQEKNEDIQFDFESETEQKILKPSFPWAILISAEKHVIDIIGEQREVEPVKTGIDELEVEDTFVITPRKNRWNEE
ncbi:MAG: hypothetical protein MI922_05100 [Bacteroidales bacterium]|nr:hypothetical protein [Bacteroidales bacterium]